MGVKIHNQRGTIELASDIFTSIAGWQAINCFGVRGMANRNVSDGFVTLLNRDNLARGVKVRFNPEGSVSVELHIVVEHGVNIPALSNSIMHEVSYMIGRLTGVPVAGVDVFVDAMTETNERRQSN